jgi:hypothetical protein
MAALFANSDVGFGHLPRVLKPDECDEEKTVYKDQLLWSLHRNKHIFNISGNVFDGPYLGYKYPWLRWFTVSTITPSVNTIRTLTWSTYGLDSQAQNTR